MEKKKVDVLEQMQNMTIDLNSKALLEKAEKIAKDEYNKNKIRERISPR